MFKALTASGDGTAHIWKAAVVPDRLSHVLGGGSSEDSPDSESEDTDAHGGGRREPRSAIFNTIKTPIIALTGHQGVVSGCQWLNDELCVTSSWDRYRSSQFYGSKVNTEWNTFSTAHCSLKPIIFIQPHRE